MTRTKLIAGCLLIAASLILLGVFLGWSFHARFPAARSVVDVPSDPLATDEARGLLSLLVHAERKHQILCGQNIGHADDPELPDKKYRYWEQLKSVTGKYPALMAVDYGWDAMPSDFRFVNSMLTEHAHAGGVVSISVHFPNPWSEGNSHDLRGGHVIDLFNEQTPAGGRWRQTLTKLADGLEELDEVQVPVLWRPLHEMNGDWFWWSVGGSTPRLTPDEFQLLWRHLYDYLTQERGLHHLIWVYAPNVPTVDSMADVIGAYPGNGVVDVVGLDYYGPAIRELDLRNAYRRLAELSKPIGLTEFGATPHDGRLDGRAWIEEVRHRFPALSYFAFWHSWHQERVAISDISSAREIMLAEGVVTLDSLGRLKPTGPVGRR